jgi:hypothetical protein
VGRPFVVGLAAGAALASAAVPAEASDVRNFDSSPISPSTNQRADQRVKPEGGSQCDGFSTIPEAENKSGNLGWGFGMLAIQSGLAHPICVTVKLQPTSTCAGITSASYAGTFNRMDALANYLGHGGNAGYSYAVGAGVTFTVVVLEATVGTGCGWHETITSQGPWADASERPRVGGAPAVGSTLAGTDATWKPNPSPTTVDERWRRCDAVGSNCTDIPGATGAGYTVTDADIGHTLRFVNVATDPDGTSTSEPNFIEPFIPFEEHPTESLTAGDRVQNGAFATGGPDGHCGVPKVAPFIANENFQFLFDAYSVRSVLNEPVCLVTRTVPGCLMTGVSPNIYNPAFAPSVGIATNYAASAGTPANTAGAAAATLSPAGTAEVVVNHGSPMGSCAQYSVTLGADAPFASARPTLAGTPIEGGTLTATGGTWSGTPAFSHSWLSCDGDGANCNPIDGATAATYTPTAADVGRRLRARVTATQGRSVSSDSEPTGVVAAAPAQPGDGRAPKAKLALARTTLQKVVKQGFIPVNVTCDEASAIALQAGVTRKVARRLGGRRIASGKGSCAPGRRSAVKVKLTRKARNGLKRRKSIALTLKATATDAAGNRGAVTKKAKIKRKV